ncbi:molybdenum cofactor biosynthesis protein B [Halorubrum sp. PV6]|uniref:MogA/MoaB family molybdenum cofactor biosynthesis protein n=1 Tax=Halorubrum sp. PV6 TaxID=634157 RepID=UPI000F84EE1C|nr:molybdenum cofactor biosynthesis protein B [Halorubrum sp. PV6]AZQ15023.1 molybdenum cofactor biosynthesis protein [Halorubrum sp. PV6]
MSDAHDSESQGHGDDGGDDHGHAHDSGDDHGHDHDGGDDHGHHSHDAASVSVAVVTVTSSRTLKEDPSGEYLVSAFESAGHEIAVHELVRDEYDSVQGTVDRLARRDDTDAVVTTGGTGVTPDDVTPEAVEPLFAKTLPGFGELFRRLSYEEVGTHTIGSRAVAGVTTATPVFCLPGSENAVRLGVDEIILPEIGHLVGLASRDSDDDTEPEAEDEDADAEQTPAPESADGDADQAS